MSDSLTFTFSLDDKTSGPLKRMTDAMEKLAQGEENVSEKAEQAHSWLERFAEIEVFKTAYEWAEKLADKVGEFGKEILSTADYSRTQKIALEGLLGSGEAAEKVFSGAKAFALEAGTPLKATVDAYRELTLAGVQVQNLPKVLQAASDLSIFKTGTANEMGEFANMLGVIQSRGQVTGLEFRRLRGLLDFRTLSKNLGVENVMKMGDTMIPAEKAIGAILTTLQQMEHGPLGRVTKAVGEGFTGAVNKLKTSWDLLLERFESSGAFDTVLHFLDRLQEQLGPTGALGQWLGEEFNKVFKSIGKWLEDLSEPGRFESIIKSFEGIATSIGRIGTAIITALPAIETAAGASQFLTGGHVFDFGEKNKFSGKRYNAADIARGLFGGDPTTEAEEGDGPSPDLVHTVRTKAPPAGQGSAPGRPPVTVNQTINVHATPGMDTDDLANHVSRVSVGDMTSAFESLGIASGGYSG